MRRLCGPLLMATGALDILYVLVFHSQQLAAIAQDGFFNTVDPDVAFSTFDRETAFWHLTFGLMAVILGGLVHWAQNRTGTLPAFLGWSLLALGAAAVFLMPLSGFWVVLPQAVMILVARRGASRAAVWEPSTGVTTVGYGANRAGRTGRI
jgi:hypothetical protein